MAELISRDDLLSKETYDARRDDFRRGIMVEKRSRRVEVGGNCMFHFENRDIMLYQILEMLRCEGTWEDDDAIDDELKAYNPLITQPGCVSTTIMFEYPTKPERETELPRLVGIDQHVWLQIGDNDRILGEFDGGQIDESKVSSVQYVKFNISSDQQDEMMREGTVVRIHIDHPTYKAQSVLSEANRKSIAQDLSA
jgi:hypothetical protein